MSHPGLNALSPGLLSWLEGELSAAGTEPILLTSAERAFSTGLDLKLLTTSDAATVEAYLRRADALCARLFHHPAPVVAAIEGHAIAGGTVLACCCDHRVALDDPELLLGLTEVALGACFPPRLLGILLHRLPARHRERVLLGGELHSPREALRLGLVDEVCAGATETARARLKSLAAHPPEIYARTKALLRAGVGELDPDAERRFIEEELPIWNSEPMRERLRKALGR